MSMRCPQRLGCIIVLGLATSFAFGQEHAVVLEFGAQSESSVSLSDSRVGPSLAVEVTPIEDVLELEFGVATSTSRHATEWETDLLFKKPWTLSPTVEFMAGLGPTWTHSNQRFGPKNTVGVEIALDFMFWPTKSWGWFLEPSYGMEFARGHEKSLGLSVGILWGPD